MKYVWKGVHKDFSAAVRDAGSIQSTAFSTQSWLQRQAKLVESSSINTQTGLIEGPRPTSLLQVLAAADTDLIIDFGGGSGWVYSFLKRFGLHPRRYIVVDLPEVVEYFLLNPTEGVEYYSFGQQIPKIEAYSNRVMYSNSALQYSADSQLLLQYLKIYCPKILVMDEVLWSTVQSDWFTVQINMERPAAVRFISVRNLMDQIRDAGLILISSSRFGTSHRDYIFPSMTNLPARLRIDHGKSLLFKQLGNAGL